MSAKKRKTAKEAHLPPTQRLADGAKLIMAQGHVTPEGLPYVYAALFNAWQAGHQVTLLALIWRSLRAKPTRYRARNSR